MKCFSEGSILHVEGDKALLKGTFNARYIYYWCSNDNSIIADPIGTIYLTSMFFYWSIMLREKKNGIQINLMDRISAEYDMIFSSKAPTLVIIQP